MDSSPSISYTETSRNKRTYKNMGNEEYNNRNYEKAIELYTLALEESSEISPDKAMILSNRAACHSMMKNWEYVVEDTTKALQINRLYEKALDRRSKAYEMLQDYGNALFDCAILLAIKNSPSNTQLATRFEGLLMSLVNRNQKISEVTYQHPSRYASNDFWSIFSDTQIFIKNVAAGKHAEVSDPIGQKVCQKIEAGNFSDAEELLSQMLTDNPSSHHCFAEMYGCLLYLKGDYGSTLEIIDKSIHHYPEAETINLLLIRGFVKMGMDDLDGCYGDFTTASKIDEDNAAYLICAGDFYLMNSDPESAYKHYIRAKDLYPMYIPAYTHLYQYYIIQQKFNEGLKTIKEGIKSCDKSVDLYYTLAEACISLSKLTDATSALTTARSIDPNNPVVYVGFSSLEVARGNKTRAIEYLESACQKDELFFLARMQLIQFYLTDKRFTEAINNIDKCLGIVKKLNDLKPLAITREISVLLQRVFETYPDFTDSLTKLLIE